MKSFDIYLENSRQYLEACLPHAAMVEVRYEIPVLVTLGIGIITSETGNSFLVNGHNNHFNVEADDKWPFESATYVFQVTRRREMVKTFRHYITAKESYLDFGDMVLKKYSKHLNPFDDLACAEKLATALGGNALANRVMHGIYANNIKSYSKWANLISSSNTGFGMRK